MSGRSQRRLGPDDALGDALRRIRVLERLAPRRGLPNLHLEAALDGVTSHHAASPDTEKLEWNENLCTPINHGGHLDPTVFGVQVDGATGGDLPFTDIPVLQPGIYWCEVRCDWWQDWGPARVNLHIAYSGSEVFPVSDSWGFLTSIASELGVLFIPSGSPGHAQTAVHRGGFMFVSDYAFTDGGTVTLFATLTNSDGSDHTFGSGTAADITIIQFTTTADSDPFGNAA